MGYGDFKLLAAIGAWLGWQVLPFVILLSRWSGAVIGIALIVLARHGREIAHSVRALPRSAGIAALFWGEAITALAGLLLT